MRTQIFVLLLISVSLPFCSPNQNAENLSEQALKETTGKAIEIIKQKDYNGFKNLFAAEIAHNISDREMHALVDKIASFLGRKEFPDNENVVLESYNRLVYRDSVQVYAIIYKFDNPTHSLRAYPRAITFNFLSKYGPDKLAGVNLTDDGN